MWILAFAISSAAAIVGFTQARSFVRARLQYVDAAQSPFAPVLAAGAAFVVGGVITGLLPLVGVGTALAFGVSVGLGVASGQRDVRRALPPGT